MASAPDRPKLPTWRDGVLSDWTVVVGAPGPRKAYALHRFALGVGDRGCEVLLKAFLASSPGGSTEIGIKDVLRGAADDFLARASPVEIKQLADKLHAAWEVVLEFLYEGKLVFDVYSALLVWRLAEVLGAALLEERIRAYTLVHIVKENAPMLLQESLLLGFDDIVRKTKQVISANLRRYDVTDLSFLDLSTLVDILGIVKVGEHKASVSRLIVSLAGLRTEEMTSGILEKIITSLIDESAPSLSMQDATILLQFPIEKLESKTGEAWEQKAFDSLCANFAALESEPSSLGSLSFDYVKKLLRREDLNIVSEDLVFRAISKYLQRFQDSLTPDQLNDLWMSCRFRELSAVAFEESLEAGMPPAVFELALTIRGLSEIELVSFSEAHPELDNLHARGQKLDTQVQLMWKDNSFTSAHSHSELVLTDSGRTLTVGPAYKTCRTALSEQSVNLDKLDGSVSWSVTVIALKGDLSIGVAEQISHSISDFVGNTSKSWSLFSAGGLMHAGKRTKGYGPKKLTVGDTIGILLDCRVRSLRFYYNGAPCGVAFRELAGVLCPAITLWNKGDCVTVDFTWKPEIVD